MMLTLIIAFLMGSRWCTASWDLRRDGMHLLHGPLGRAVRHVGAGELERPPSVVTAAGVELRGMVGKGEQMSAKKLIEATPRGVELCLGLVELPLRHQHVGQTPPDLRIGAREGWHE